MTPLLGAHAGVIRFQSVSKVCNNRNSSNAASNGASRAAAARLGLVLSEWLTHDAVFDGHDIIVTRCTLD